MQSGVILAVVLSIMTYCQSRNIYNLGIINGEDAKQGEFPYMVSIRLSSNCHLCGGSIIGDRWILTAGHCIIDDITTVRFGAIELNSCKEDNTSIAIKSAFTIPSFYNKIIAHNDVGLIQLEEPITFNENVQPIKLPDDNETLPFNQTVVFTGWGITNLTNITPYILQKVNLTLFDDNYCLSALNDDYFTPAEMICAGDVENTKAQCSGDSGGPLVVNGVQYGIASWSHFPCAISPGVLTRLPVYRDEIRQGTGI